MSAEKNKPETGHAGQEVVITRIFNAPRELVFKAWTDPEQLAQWYAPNGCSIEFKKLEIREGGEFHSCVHTPEGYKCWCRGTYREIVAPERIVYTMAIANEKGDFVGAQEAGLHSDWPRETVVTVTFIEQGDKTKLTLHQTVAESLAKQTGAYPSWLQMLDRMESLIGQG